MMSDQLDVRRHKDLLNLAVIRKSDTTTDRTTRFL